MGTGIAAHGAVEAMKEGLGRVDGIILDSPFHSFRLAFESISSWIPSLFDIPRFLEEIDLNFDNVKVKSVGTQYCKHLDNI